MNNLNIFTVLALFVYAFSFVKDFFSCSYVVQLKEYRWLKFREYFFSRQGRISFGGVKAFVRLFFVLSYFVYVSVFPSTYIGFLPYLGVGFFCFWIAFEGHSIWSFFRHGWKYPVFTARFLLLLIISFLLFFVFLYCAFAGGLLIYALLLSYFFIPLFLFFAIFLTSPLEGFLLMRVVKQATDILYGKELEVIAISGSYGKSSVKNFLTAILHTYRPSVCTEGNINTVKGVARFIRDVIQERNDIAYFICEMGGDTPGEISTIGSMVHHRVGFLTGLNNQHSALYGGLQAAIAAETEILEQLSLCSGTLYVNMDSEYVKNLSFPSSIHIVGYSITDPSCTVFANITGYVDGIRSFDLLYQGVRYHFSTDVAGRHNVLNLSGVVACCLDLGMNEQQISHVLPSLSSHQKTLHRFFIHSSCLIDDRYNINVDGVFAGVRLLSDYDVFSVRVVVINEIIELGSDASETHRRIGMSLSSSHLDYIFLTGANYGSFIRDGLIQGGFSSDRIVDCTCVGFEKSFSLLYRLVRHSSSVVLFLGREQGSLKFFDKLLV